MSVSLSLSVPPSHSPFVSECASYLCVKLSSKYKMWVDNNGKMARLGFAATAAAVAASARCKWHNKLAKTKQTVCNNEHPLEHTHTL